MSTFTNLDKTHTAVPLAKYQQLFDVVAQAIELLKPQGHEHAKESYSTLVTLSAKFTTEKDAFARAQKALADARDALKRNRTLAAQLVPGAITMGKVMEIPTIINFIPADDSWTESVEALARRFEAHSKTGKGIAAALRSQVEKRRAAEAEVEHAAEQVDRASQAFSATYRHLSNALVFGRAVLLNLGVALPSTNKPATKKRKATEPTAKPQEPVQVPNVVLAPAA